jgi:hypothetical protein
MHMGKPYIPFKCRIWAWVLSVKDQGHRPWLYFTPERGGIKRKPRTRGEV